MSILCNVRKAPEPELFLLQQNILKQIILIILINTQISFRDLEGRVVINFHEKCRWCTFFPGMISKGLTERMTAYFMRNFTLICGKLQNAVGLNSGNGFIPIGM